MRDSVRVRGQAAIMVSLSLVVSLGVLGLVSDLGWMYWRKEVAETAAKSAVMAGIVQASKAQTSSTFQCNSGGVSCNSTPQTCSTSPTNGNTFSTACLYAKQNGFTASGRQNVTIAGDTGVAPTVPGVTTAYWITARVTEQIPLTFLAVLGSGYWGTVAARSTAAVISTAAGSCVYTLDPANTSMSLSNGVTVTSECGFWDNSNSSSALSVVGGARMIAKNNSQIVVHGGDVINNGGSASPAPKLNQPSFNDPFASKPVPWADSASSRTYECDYTGCNHTTCDYTQKYWNSWVQTLTLNPGVYCGGLNVGNVGSVVLNPGVYIINGGGINFGSGGGISGGVSGTNVSFFDTGTNSTYVGITLGNGINFKLSAPTSGSLAGVLFYQDPGITAPTGNATSYFNGGSNFQLQGTIYLPGTTLNFSNGTSTSSVSTALIVKDLVFTGGAYFKQDTTGVTGLGGSNSIYWIE